MTKMTWNIPRYFDSSKRHNFEMGRSRIEFLVLTSAVRTKPSWPGNTLETRPRSQWPRSLTTRTKSLTPRLRRFRIHFLRSCSRGRYSRCHLVQKWFERSWPLRHCLRECRSSFWKAPSGRDIPWLGHHYLGIGADCWVFPLPQQTRFWESP